MDWDDAFGESRVRQPGPRLLEACWRVRTPYLVDDIIVRVRELSEQPDPQGEMRARFARELAGVEGQIGNLADAIAAGGEMAALVGRLSEGRGTPPGACHAAAGARG